MPQVRLFALALISFVATLISSFLAPGTFLHRALSVATFTVFSFNWTLCVANLVRSGDRVVAANPPAIFTELEVTLAKRRRDEICSGAVQAIPGEEALTQVRRLLGQ